MSGLPATDKLKDLYTRYKYHELTFSETILKSSGIIRRDTFLKAGSSKWLCKIISASMTGVRLAVNLSAEEIAAVKEASSLQVHFSFLGFKPYFIPISFDVPYHLSELTNSSSQRGNAHLITLCSSDSPPDLFIRMLGELISIQDITTKRSEARITVTDATAVELGLKSPHNRIRISDSWNECLLKDFSFSGCQVIMNSQLSLEKKRVFLEIFFQNPDSLFEIPGTVLRVWTIKESGDKAAAGIRFDEDEIPYEYTERLHKLVG